MAGVGLASAETTTSTTSAWTTDQGTAIREYSTSKKYSSFSDPALPGSVTLYPLPETLTVSSSERYSYSIINERPVVAECPTRKVIHTWE